MKRRMLLLVFLSFFTVLGYSQTYIQNATIVDVVHQKLLPKQTVVINNGIISHIQSARGIKILAHANVIDGDGKFLMPGMTDAHVHFFQSGGVYTRPDAIGLRKFQPYEKEIVWVHENMEDFLRRDVQNGITSVIDAGASCYFLQQRDTFQHTTYALRIFMARPLPTFLSRKLFMDLGMDEPFILVSNSFYCELAMKQAGLTNWQIFRSATFNPARILNHQDSLGGIAVEKKTDLVLLNANPADRISNLREIALVINKGQIIDPDTLIHPTPETLVQQQVNAFNLGNIDAFLAPYADSIELYNFPDHLIGKGKDMMRKQYGQVFIRFPDLHCEIKDRMIFGNTVIDHESVTGMGQQGRMEAIAIYEIQDGKIVKAYFIK